MPIILWSESDPQGSDSIGLGDDQIRSLKTSVRIGLDAEHVWPSGGGDAGVHRLGSARPYVTTQSLISSTGTDGRLAWTSDTSQFFHVGSGGTAFIGGARVISAGSYPGAVPPQRYYWADEWGEGKTVSGITTVAFPNSGYSGKPFVVCTPCNTSSPNIQTIYIITMGAASFTVRSSATDNLMNSTTSFFWRSVGTRVL